MDILQPGTPRNKNTAYTASTSDKQTRASPKRLDSDREGVVTVADDAIEPLEYGVQAQLGFQLSRFFIEINATNQMNTLIRGDWVQLNQEIAKLKLRTFSLNLTFNF